MKNTKEAEARLMRAIDDVALKVDAGMTPHDAVVKVARDSQLRPGYVTTLVRAYNTGVTGRQRDLGDSVLTKAAEVPLVDPGEVLEELYPSKIATAAETIRASRVSTEYAVNPADMLARHAHQKLAGRRGVLPPMCDPPPPLPANPEAALRKLAAQEERGRKDVEEARRLSSEAYDQMTRGFIELSSYFKNAGCIPFPQFQRQATALHGHDAEVICEQVVGVSPQFSKQADNPTAPTPSLQSPPFVLLRKLAAAVKNYNRLYADFKSLEEKTGAALEAARLPFVQARVESNPETSSSGATKRANFVWNPFTQAVLGSASKDTLTNVANRMGPTPDEDLKNNALESLTDPAHEATLRNIRTQSTLHDLMTHDPVIKGYPQNEAFEAFNDVQHLAPRTGDSRAIMQTLLRQRLTQGQLGGFDIDQLLGMENKLKQREGAPGVTTGSLL